jgi:hypothetical protein
MNLKAIIREGQLIKPLERGQSSVSANSDGKEFKPVIDVNLASIAESVKSWKTESQKRQLHSQRQFDIEHGVDYATSATNLRELIAIYQVS